MQRIHLYCLCWNDARMLPYFFRHYDSFVDRYFVYDNGSTDGSIDMLHAHGSVEVRHFDVTGDSFVEEERRLGDTMWQGSDADWVIVTDIDEHIYHPDLSGYLLSCREQGITAIQSVGYEMISESFPVEDRLLVETITEGVRSSGLDRLCIFDPQAITATNYEPGRHGANPEGQVVWPAYPQILLLHYKQLGTEYLIARSSELRQGLRSGDLEKEWGTHYTWSAAKLRANWKKMKAGAATVPGLGSLSHIEPSKYAEEESVVRLSGLIDGKWYLGAYPDVDSVKADPLLHFSIHGWREGRKPNFYFDPRWYRRKYPRLSSAKRNPLYDFIVRGEAEDAWPSPFFDTPWYRKEYGLSPTESPLRHYMARRGSGQVSPNPEFDAIEYCRSHPEVVTEGDDPFEHYCREQSELEESN
jgi:hypothetical protein